MVGATGVPVCGDPGWERANRNPNRPVEYQRDYYGAGTPSAGACDGAGPGRKRIRWYAEQVHHFAMSLNPDYRYEGGHFGNVAVHVLYQPGDEKTWGGGVAVERTQTALAWLDQLYGPFGWPQITNVHRIEGGGTEFPMMIHDGSADQGLIVHELGHNYTMGLLANNEWREGWLDEGFTSFQTTLVLGGDGQAEHVRETTRRRCCSSISTTSRSRRAWCREAYRDFTSYNIAIYSRGELFFHQLRDVVGDETMHRILQHLLRAMEVQARGRGGVPLRRRGGVAAGSLDLLRPVAAHDRAVRLRGRPREGATHHRDENGTPGWVTRVEVVRKAPGQIPVDVAVIAAGRHGARRGPTDWRASEWVEIETRTRPREVLLDPRVHAHDWNMLNNRRRLGFSWSAARWHRLPEATSTSIATSAPASGATA